MFVSEKRIIANRKNAQFSTGPRTSEGKERSRANALKHGLCASVVVEENLELVQERTQQWFYALKPQNQYHNWMIDRLAILSIRIERSERIERRVRDKGSLRAELFWDTDRQHEIEILGSRLEMQPAETVSSLKKTPQGCEWLMTRWAMLAFVGDEGKGWTEEQSNLAFDMLATPMAFRKGRKPGVSMDFDGKLVDSALDESGVARREIAALKAQREIAADLDEVERALIETDLNNDGDAELRRLRRYESGLFSRLKWCIGQINNPSPHDSPARYLTPSLIDPPHLEEKPEPPTEEEKLAAAHPEGSIHPPFDLEPDEFPEPGKNADIPMILKSRKQRRMQKAETRRNDRRRKVEKLLA